MYRLISNIYPKKVKEIFYKLFSHTNIPTDNDRFIGFIASFIILLSLGMGFILGLIYNINFIPVSIISFIVINIIFYFWLILNATKKAEYIEDILPDALFLIASNLRSGFTTDKAILLSARDEFGPFKEELLKVSKEITTGRSLEQSLSEAIERVNSKKLEKTFSLIISGLRSGGRLADLLQETANDLKNQKIMDKKVRASVNMYAIFIFIAVAFGAPLLFGLSSFLVEVLTTTLKSIEIPTTVSGAFNLPISIKPGNITPKFVIIFSLINLITISIFGAFMIGLIKKGREKEGILLIPVLLTLSITIFLLVRLLVKITIGSLFLI